MTAPKKWIPKELRSAAFLCKPIDSPDEFDLLLTPRVDVWQRHGSGGGGERKWLLRRLINHPEKTSNLIPAANKIFLDMNREKFMGLLQTLFDDGYHFCKLANRAGKRNVRTLSLYIRGDREEPWANCRWCPASQSCRLKEEEIKN